MQAANGEWRTEKRKTARATNAAPIFMFKVTKRNETKRSGHSSQKLIVWPRFRLAFVCMCVCVCCSIAVAFLGFWLAAVSTWPFHAIFVITSSQYTYGWKNERAKSQAKTTTKLRFFPIACKCNALRPTVSLSSGLAKAEKKRFNASSNAEFGIGLGARASDTLCQPSAYGQIQYVHLHTTIYIHR